jgi:hypothetical protein
MSDGIAIPGGRRLCRMRLIQAHVTDLIILTAQGQ